MREDEISGQERGVNTTVPDTPPHDPRLGRLILAALLVLVLALLATFLLLMVGGDSSHG